MLQVTGKTLFDIVGDIDGAEIASIDTLTVPKLNKRGNPHFGRVLKRMEGGSVLLFTNKRTNTYENKVRKHLTDLGMNPDKFQLSPRAWGQRMPESPFIVHEKDGQIKYYLDTIFLREPKQVEWLLDGKPIAKEEIIGLVEPKMNDDAQGGLGNTGHEVIIRTFAFESVKRIRTDKREYLL